MSGPSSSLTPDTAAKAAFAAGDFEAAAQLYSSLLERRSAVEQRHLLLCNRAAALMKMGRYEDAANDARDAIQDAPEGFVKAHYRLACALRGAGDNAGAQAACDDALQIRPGNDQLKALRESCLSDTLESAAPTAAGGMIDRARQAQQANEGGAPAARGGMLQRARAKKEGIPGEPVLVAAPAAPESTDPAAPARNGMLERARAKKQET
jgi:tetratricopeptide (TPR) repeat protein